MIDDPFPRCHAWFHEYAATFAEQDPAHRRNLDLKTEHTMRVVAAMEKITAGLGLAAQERTVARLTALFHDLGRYRQYRDFRTFRDPDSVNHAQLSLLELHRHRVLADLSAKVRNLVCRAIILHNRLRLPRHLDSRTMLHCRLIRDADKVDILRLMAEHFGRPPQLRDPVVTLGLDQKAGVRPEIYQRLFAGRMLNYLELDSAEEFKILLLSWVFDINFAPTRALLRQQGHLHTLAASLPAGPLARRAKALIEQQLQQET